MDTTEIIRQMQRDPALRAELRAVLLGEEILSLPALVRENSLQIAELVVRMDRVEAQIAELVVRMDRVEAQIAELTEAIRTMDLRLSTLEKDMVIVKADLGDIKGKQLEDDVRSHPRAYVRKTHLISLRTLTYDEKYDLSESLEEGDRGDLDRLDAILHGKRHDGTEAYVAVEASRTLENHDLLRVLRRAKLLAGATGIPVLPLTVCSIAPDDRACRRALELNVAIARKNDGIISEAPFLAS